MGQSGWGDGELGDTLSCYTSHHTLRCLTLFSLQSRKVRFIYARKRVLYMTESTGLAIL